MSDTNKAWIQSALLVANDTSKKSDQNIEARNISEVGKDQPLKVKTLSQGFSATDGKHISELCRDEPYWPFTAMRFSHSFKILGNGVAVHSLPIVVKFQIYCMVCGTKQGSISYSWEIVGPGGDESLPTVQMSSPKQLEMLPLTIFPKKISEAFLPISMAIVKENIAPIFEKEGLYFVVIRLNDHEENRIPLFVWREAGE